MVRAWTPLGCPPAWRWTLPHAPGETRSGERFRRLLRAPGRARHWQRLLDEQRAASVAGIAEAEGMDVAQARRVIRRTLLAPAVIEPLVGRPALCWSG